MNELDFLSLFDKVAAVERTLIVGHRRPDGDCVGSAAALAHLLHAMGRRAEIIFPDPVPKRLEFLLAGLSVCSTLPDDLGDWRILCVDVASPDQLGTLNESLAGQVYLRIDHHDIGVSYACFEFVRPCASATGEIIFDLCERAVVLGLVPAVPDAALAAVYGAISADTGCFKYSNVTPDTHLRAARLIASGVDATPINQRLFDMKDRSQIRAEQIMQNALEFYENGRVSALVIDHDFFTDGLTYTDFDTAVDIVRGIRGVLIGVVVKKTDEPGIYRVSLRGNDRTRVSDIAAAFGGGGHTCAAGCTVCAADGHEALERVLKVIQGSAVLETCGAKEKEI